MLRSHLIRAYIVLVMVMSAQAVKAHEPNEFDLKIVDVANRYSAATNAAKLCDRFEFEDKAQEEAYISNSNLSKIYAARIFIQQFPALSHDELTVKSEEMDRKLETAINRFYNESGCSHNLIQRFIQWFDTLRKFPKAPYPKPDISEKDFQDMGMRWVILNNLS